MKRDNGTSVYANDDLIKDILDQSLFNRIDEYQMPRDEVNLDDLSCLDNEERAGANRSAAAGGEGIRESELI